MVHDEWLELISASVDGELDADEERTLSEHLASCPSCAGLRSELEVEHRRARFRAPQAHDDLVGAVLAQRGEERELASGARSVLLRRGGIAAAAIAAAVIGLVLVVSRAQPAPPVTGADEVSIAALNASFDHPEVEVKAGTTVEWRNDGATEHHLVRRLGGAVVGDDLAPGQTETATFDQPGTFEFFCTIHPEMSGTVIVDA